MILLGVLALSGLNTYLILDGTRQAMQTSVVNYDYVLSQDGGNYKLKNMLTGYVTDQRESASIAINTAMAEGKSIYLNPGSYTLTDDVYIGNKLNAKLISDGAIINGNGHKIVIYGDNYTTAQYAFISGLILNNATIRVENSLGTTISDTKFIDTATGIEFQNSNTWSEYNKIENCHFINNTEGIVFRTPQNESGLATGSYASSTIERCSFNILDFSTGIIVEAKAEFSDSQIQNVRFWMGENGCSHQTALQVDGSMYQTLLLGVVFESFTDDPVDMFAIDIGPNCDPAPILQGGVSFLGTWTARIHNTDATWISSSNTVFKHPNQEVPIGTNGQYNGNLSIQCKPLLISEFKPKISVSSSFSHSETVTVRVRIEYIDNTFSEAVTKTFASNGSQWLSDDDMITLFPSHGIIWAIIVDAKTNAATTDAKVIVSGYGTAG